MGMRSWDRVMARRMSGLRPGLRWGYVGDGRGFAYRGGSWLMKVHRGMRRRVSGMRDCRREVGLGGEVLVSSREGGDRAGEVLGLER